MSAIPPLVPEPGPEYRRNVGLMLLNDRGRVWVGRRTDTDLDAWQMPQGGIDDGEEPLEAAKREALDEACVSRPSVSGEGHEDMGHPGDSVKVQSISGPSDSGSRTRRSSMSRCPSSRSIRPTRFRAANAA